MDRRIKTPVLLLALGIWLASPAWAGDADEATLDVLVATIDANQKALVAVNMDLTDDEAKAFWPLYDRYETDLGSLRTRMAALVADYTENFTAMSDDKAEEILEEYLKIESERALIRESYADDFAEVLPPKKVVRFYQIENKIHAVVRYDLARTIPVIEE